MASRLELFGKREVETVEDLPYGRVGICQATSDQILSLATP